jgi:CRP-like cAMP-binding protein
MSARFPAVPIEEHVQEDTMADEDAPSGLRDRIARQGEDALGKLAQELLENPLVNSAIARAFDARERASQAQEAAMGALNIPSAADVERLTRRLRSVSQRMEGIEEAVDRLDQRLAAMAQPAGGIEERLAGVEGQLAKLASEISNLASTLDTAPAPVPREQERMKVDEPPPKAPARRRTTKTKT